VYEDVGVVGLGDMDTGRAENILAVGFDLFGYALRDRTPGTPGTCPVSFQVCSAHRPFSP